MQIAGQKATNTKTLTNDLIDSNPGLLAQQHITSSSANNPSNPNTSSQTITTTATNSTGSSSSSNSRTSTLTRPTTLTSGSGSPTFRAPTNPSSSSTNTTAPQASNTVATTTTNSMVRPQSLTGTRDRSHLALALNPTRRRAGLDASATTNTTTNNNNNYEAQMNEYIASATAILQQQGAAMQESPLDKNLRDFITAFVSPEPQRASFDLSSPFASSAAASALQAHFQQQLGTLIPQAHNDNLETPTPSKLIYPRSITDEQQEFADGFTRELNRIQAQNQFNPAPLLNSPSITPSVIKLIVSVLTPTLSQPPAFPGTSNSTLNSPVDPTKAPISRPEGAENLLQLSPCAPHSSSTGTTLSPQSDNSLVNFPGPAAGSSSAHTTIPSSVNAKTSTSSVTSVAAGGGTAGNTFSELVRKLDPNNTQNYMDMFNQHDLVSVSFPSFVNPVHQQQSTSSASMLPPHLHPTISSHQQQSQAAPTSQQSTSTNRNHNGIAIKSEPMQHEQSASNALAAVSALSAMQQNGYSGGAGGSAANGMHHHSHPHASQLGACAPMPQQPLTSHQPATSGGRYSAHGGPSLDMDDQERKKLERKRARNRAAATKCRQRKMERIQELEGQVQQERQRSSHLESKIEQAKLELQQMRDLIEQHQRSGCGLGAPIGLGFGN